MFSNRSNLIKKFIIICRGLVYPSVRVLVPVRMLREFGYSRGKCGVVYRGGALINNRDKLSVNTTPWLYVCMQRFKKKCKVRGLVDRFHSLKSYLLSISCSHANHIDFLIDLAKLDKTYRLIELFIFLPELF